jgi:predicted permease
MKKLLRRLRYLLGRERSSAELAEEMEFHRAMAEQEGAEAGLMLQEARRRARRQMGNETLAREDAHYVWSFAAAEGAWQDLRYAWRGLWRNKTLLAVACLSLALSTGFGTAVFSIVNAVILQPVTAANLDRLVSFDVGGGNRVSWLTMQDLCGDGQPFHCVGYRVEEEVVWERGEDRTRVTVQAVSADYFAALGAGAAQGRVFTNASVEEMTNEAVVTYLFWQRHLGGAADVIGSKLQLGGGRYTVVGVLPQGFRSVWGLGVSPSIYVPAGSSVRPASANRRDGEYELLAVLEPGQDAAGFQSRMQVRAAELEELYPADNRDFSQPVEVQPLPRFGKAFAQIKADRMTRTLLTFSALLTVFILLLAAVACINVAGLLVARAMAREREIAVRRSIGCGRFRLVRLLFAESFLIALAGIGLGALLSLALARMLIATPLPFPVPFEVEIPLDRTLFSYLAGLTGLATLMAGLAPVIHAWRTPAAASIGHAQATAGRGRLSMRRVLIVAQVAASTVLLIGATLFVRSLQQASQVDPGFELDRVVTVELDARSGLWPDEERASRQRAAMAALETIPGVDGVSAADIVPLSMSSQMIGMFAKVGEEEQLVTVYANTVLPGYFNVMGIPLRAGREFGEEDLQEASQTVIVNETFARRIFPDGSALGQRLRRPAREDEAPPLLEIVGVAADSRYWTLGEETRPTVYWPGRKGGEGASIIHVRTADDAAALARQIPAELEKSDPQISVTAKPLRDVMALALFPAKVAAVLLGGLGLVGWILTVAGLYGVVSFGAARRVPEIGVRTALGATRGSILRLLLREGLLIAGVGLTFGLGAAALATPLLAAFLVSVAPYDGVSFAAVAVGLLLTALAASYGPARKGARISPTQALRSE